jgi:hypothetical protein
MGWDLSEDCEQLPDWWLRTCEMYSISKPLAFGTPYLNGLTYAVIYILLKDGGKQLHLKYIILNQSQKPEFSY